MFSKFPKTRSVLPEEYQNIFKNDYIQNRNGETTASSLSQKMESWLHLQVSKDLKKARTTLSTLEIGAGTLNQLKYEVPVGTYDIVEPFTELYAPSPDLYKVRNIFKDVSEISTDHTYDRITSCAVLENICNLPELVAKCGLLLSPEGSFRASIPSEGTFLWTLGWQITTGLEFRLRYGLDKGKIIEHEHVNDASEIEEVLSFFFHDTLCNVFGVSKKISLYRFYECRNPNLDRCRSYLESSLSK